MADELPVKVVVATPIWKRYELTAYCLAQWASWKCEGVEFEFVVVGSEGPFSRKCLPDDKRFHYVEHINWPLGAKFNAAVKGAMALKPDYVMIMGSDQIVSDSIFEEYKKHFGSPYIGVEDIYIYDLAESMVYYWPGYSDYRKGKSVGPGRMIARRILEQTGPPYDPKKNRGLDGSMDRVMPIADLISGEDHGMLTFKTYDSINATHLYGGMNWWKADEFMLKHFGHKLPPISPGSKEDKDRWLKSMLIADLMRREKEAEEARLETEEMIRTSDPRLASGMIRRYEKDTKRRI